MKLIFTAEDIENSIDLHEYLNPSTIVKLDNDLYEANLSQYKRKNIYKEKVLEKLKKLL